MGVDAVRGSKPTLPGVVRLHGKAGEEVAKNVPYHLAGRLAAFVGGRLEGRHLPALKQQRDFNHVFDRLIENESFSGPGSRETLHHE
jgi:hypothetical protein